MTLYLHSRNTPRCGAYGDHRRTQLFDGESVSLIYPRGGLCRVLPTPGINTPSVSTYSLRLHVHDILNVAVNVRSPEAHSRGRLSYDFSKRRDSIWGMLATILFRIICLPDSSLET
jgi:hypothetical protein